MPVAISTILFLLLVVGIGVAIYFLWRSLRQNLPITDCARFGNSSEPTRCPDGREIYNSTCVLACPEGWSRTAACTCQRGTGPITDCGRFGEISSPDRCDEPGFRDWWGLRCYTDQCNNDGGRRTASCTCDFGPIRDVVTDCGRFYNQPCPPGWHKTAICTCQQGGIVTDCGRYGESRDAKCPTDSDEFAGSCYRQRCPEGYRRTASCTCDNLEVETDCARYGDPKALGDPLGPSCDPATHDYNLGLCYEERCPAGYQRTAACTCARP